MKKIILILVILIVVGCQKQDITNERQMIDLNYKPAIENVSDFIWDFEYRKTDYQGSFVFYSKKINKFRSEYLSKLNLKTNQELLKKMENITTQFFEKQELKSANIDEDPGAAIQGVAQESESFLMEFLELLDTDSISASAQKRIQEIVVTINSEGAGFLHELNAQADSINGKLVLDSAIDDSGLLTKKLLTAIETEELAVFNSNQLMLGDKEKILMFTYAIKTNLEPIIALFSSGNGLKSVNGLWKSLKRAFKKVVSAVVTVVTTVVGTIAGAVGGFTIGGIPGAIAGGTLGFTAGVKTADYFNCKWFLDHSYCQECKDEHPRGEFPC